jgi:NAD-dependent DNA ligase
MYDGIVVSYLVEDIREALGRKNYINQYSMAVKFNPLKKQTIFRGYEFTIGQDGLITPMIFYDPVEFYGTIHHKSTGSSYQRFMDLGLRIGDIVNVEYTNDVMPYVTKPDCTHNDNNTNPLCEFPTVCPDCGTELEFSKTGKSAMCNNINCGSRIIARMSNMLAKLNLKDFGRQRIIALNKSHLYEIIDLTRDDVYDILGDAMSTKFIDIMNDLKTKPIADYEIIGALGFSNIATKKWKLIFHYLTLNEFYNLYLNGNLGCELIMIRGIGPTVIDTINAEMEFFKKDIEYILYNMKNVVSTRGMKQGKSIRCSGFRNKELMEQLRSRGYDADDNGSVTKSTDILLVPYEDYSSSKTKKVGPDTIIVPVSDFVENIDKYLN